MGVMQDNHSTVKATAPSPLGGTTGGVREQPTEAAKIASVVTDKSISAIELEAQIEQILKKKKAAHIEAQKPREPDWASLTELDAYRQDVYIPVINHEIPDYMNIKLKDTSYDVVWANRDQRRLGQLLAEGYELLKPEHLHSDFKHPLEFNSEGMYIYQDVVAMRVHKRILYGKRRKALEISQQQLRTRGADARIKAKLAEIIEGDPGLEHAFAAKGLDYYET
jgi:hypothetical protein